MEIVYAAAEMVPFAKVGGLGDVAGALTAVLARRRHRVTAFLPLYPSVRRHWTDLAPEEATRISIRIAGAAREARVWRARVPGTEVALCLVENDGYFDRPNPYIDPKTSKDWPDNAERFTFFSRAILETCLALGWTPDVFHLNDYQVALVPVLLREEHRDDALRRCATVLSIHNLGYQGIFPDETGSPTPGALVRDLGLAPRLIEPLGPLEYYGRLNFTKAGLIYADLITTVSPTYAREIQTAEFGSGLDGVLRDRSDRVIGILNGIDIDVWDPARDSLIPHPYGPSDFPGKAENKRRLLEAMHLPAHPDLPIVGIISRLVDQKGFDLLAEIADELLAAGGLRLVVLGSGMPKYEQWIRDLARSYPQHCACSLTFDDPLAHLIEAGADYFLMPSRYEPCGLNQMYSMRYGTIPIVRATGGLADTVEEFDPRTGRGSGFVFREYEPEALSAAIDRALALYPKTRARRALVTRIMKLDFSWDRAAQTYERAYARVVAERRGA
jgi:starch synthase